MPLQVLSPPDASTTHNMLIYGPPGTGKTVAAASAPGPVLYVNAEGQNALRKAREIHGDDKLREVRFEGAQTLIDVYNHVKEGKADERTVVLDTVGEAYTILLGEYGSATPTLPQYGEVNLKIERWVRALRDLDVNVVLVCHEQVDDGSDEVTRRPRTGGRQLPETLMAIVDVVAYTAVIAETEDTPRQYVGQLVSANGRRAKDRSGVLGKFRELNLTEWIETANGVVAPAEKSTPKPKRRAA